MSLTLTPLGRFLRKLRIDRNELLRTMADKLGVSSAFLSSVEMGRKKMPSSWEGRIVERYMLDDGQQQELSNAIADSVDAVPVDVAGLAPESRRVAWAFARRIKEIDEKQLERIAELLKGSSK